METVTLATVLTLLAPFAAEAGKTLAVESVKLALEKREDIKDKFVSLFKTDDIISLGLNDNQSSEEVKTLLADNPKAEEEIKERIKENSDLLDELAKVLSKQEGRTIHATNYFEYVNTINIDQRRS